MENTDRDTANAAPQNDWQDAETTAPIIGEPTHYTTEDEAREPLYASGGNEEKKEEEENEEEEEDKEENEEDDDAGDWGHVDPVESHNPFSRDPNEPTAPGSAV